MARNLPGPVQGQQQSDEKIEVLSTLPVKEIDLSAKPAGIATNSDERATMDPSSVAPIVRSAVDAPPIRVGMGQLAPVMQGSRGEDAPKPRLFRVEATKVFVDRTSGARTRLHEGKEISAKHYNIRDLQQQGVRLRDITDVPADAPL